MVSEFKGRAELELVPAIFQRGAHKGGGVSKVPCIRSEMLVAAAITDKAGKSVVDLKVESSYATHRFLGLLPPLGLQAVIDGAAHGIVHEHASDVWIDASKG